MVAVDIGSWTAPRADNPAWLPVAEEQILWDEYLVRPGIKLLVQNRPAINRSYRFDFSIEQAPVEVLYCLSGETSLCMEHGSGERSCVTTRQGWYTLSCLPHTSGTSTTQAGVPLQAVGLQIAPLTFRRLAAHSGGAALCERADGEIAPFFMEKALPLPLKVTVRQILECSLQGAARTLFLEYKAMELLYTQLGLLDAVINGNKGISSRECEAANRARDILVQNMAAPPSLLELAKSVGLTHSVLNRTFRSLFGNTVFNVLREIRLESARRMLEDGRFNVAEVAYECGFSSPSHLSRAFFSSFGLQPKRYQSESMERQHIFR